ncbi:hypothetical protein N9Q05_02430 [bacterium]|nr:hypothetical protein [bacterium]
MTNVLIELLPLLNPAQQFVLLNTGIVYCARTSSESHNEAQATLRNHLQCVNTTEKITIHQVDPHLFQSHVERITEWINVECLDNPYLQSCLHQALDELQNNRRYSGDTPSYHSKGGHSA